MGSMPLSDPMCHDAWRHNLETYAAVGSRTWKADQDWTPYKASRYMAQALQEAADTPGSRLIITVPPRGGKTELLVWLMRWYLDKHPDREIIYTCYGANLAVKQSKRVRDWFADPRTPTRARVSALASQKQEWELEVQDPESGGWVASGGGMRAAGVGGGITGTGGHVLICDDPFKDWAEAISLNTREGVWNWYRSTFYTRRHPGASVIVVHTRWHEDDLIGRLLKQEQEALARDDGEREGPIKPFRVIHLPAIANHNPELGESDLLGREVGEALCEQRYPAAELRQTEVDVGDVIWSAVYQGSPRVGKGLLYAEDDFIIEDDPPEWLDEVLLSWDMSFKELETSSYVVGQVWGRQLNTFWLLDEVRGQWGFRRTLRQLLQQSAQWPQAVTKLIEDKANGTAVMDVLNQELHITPVEPYGSKWSRAVACQGIVQSGAVKLLRRPFTREWLKEVSGFPTARYNDRVDAMTQALNYWRSRGSATAGDKHFWKNLI